MSTLQFINKEDYLLFRGNNQQAKLVVFSNDFKFIRIGKLRPWITDQQKINEIKILLSIMGIKDSPSIHIDRITYIPNYQLSFDKQNVNILGLTTFNPIQINPASINFTYIPNTLNYRLLNTPIITYLNYDKITAEDKSYVDFFDTERTKLILTMYVCGTTLNLQDIIIEQLITRKYHYFLTWEYNNAPFIFADVNDEKQIRQILTVMGPGIMNGQLISILKTIKSINNLPSYMSSRATTLLNLFQFLQEKKFLVDDNFNEISSIYDYLTLNKTLTFSVKEISLAEQALMQVKTLGNTFKSKFNDLDFGLQNKLQDTEVYKYYFQNPELIQVQTQARAEIEKFNKYILDYENKIKNTPDEIQKWKNLTSFFDKMINSLNQLHNEHEKHFNSPYEEQKQKEVHKENVLKIVKTIENTNNTVQFHYFENHYYKKLKNHLLALKFDDFKKDFEETYKIIIEKTEAETVPNKLKNLLCHIIYLLLTYIDVKSVSIFYYINLYIFLVTYNYSEIRSHNKVNSLISFVFGNEDVVKKEIKKEFKQVMITQNMTLPINFWIHFLDLIFVEISKDKNVITFSKKGLLELLSNNLEDSYFRLVSNKLKKYRVDHKTDSNVFKFFINEILEEKPETQVIYYEFVCLLFLVNKNRREKSRKYIDQNDDLTSLLSENFTEKERTPNNIKYNKALIIGLYDLIQTWLNYDKIDFIFYALYILAYNNFDQTHVEKYRALKTTGLNQMIAFLNENKQK
jgi:hypothetical protein